MDEILELLKSGDIKGAYALMAAKTGVDNNVKEFNNDRKIRDTQVGKRPDKVTKADTVKVAKIPISFQRQIVKTAATFLFGSPVKIIEKKDSDSTSDDGEAFKAIIDLWDDMRMDQTLLKFCKAVKSETEAAIVFYDSKKEGETDIKIKSRLLTNANGKVYPIFDSFGDMIAFAWEYMATENKNEVKYLYTWTDEAQYANKLLGGSWQPLEKYPRPNLFKKIPAVYLSQENTEWWEVQDLIDNFEVSFSKFIDTNAYFASPMYKAKGGVQSMPKKDDTGKMVKLDIIETDKGNIIEADLEVISWDRAPEALKLEFDTSKDLIYGLSNTVDLSFNNLKGLGNIANFAMQLMFLGPILKAKEAEGDYQTVISRAINVMKAGIGNIAATKLSKKLSELRTEVRFTSVLPENILEIIQMLTEATAGKAIMSQKTAIGHNPLIDDTDQELENLKEEEIVDLGTSEL